MPPLLDGFDLLADQKYGQPGKVQQPAPRGPMGPQAPAGTLPNQGANPPMALAANHPQVAQRPPDSFDVAAASKAAAHQPATAPQWPQEGPQMGSPGQTAYLPMSTPPMALATNHAAEPSRIWGTGGQPVRPSPPQSFPDGQIGPAGSLTQPQSKSRITQFIGGVQNAALAAPANLIQKAEAGISRAMGNEQHAVEVEREMARRNKFGTVLGGEPAEGVAGKAGEFAGSMVNPVNVLSFLTGGALLKPVMGAIAGKSAAAAVKAAEAAGLSTEQAIAVGRVVDFVSRHGSSGGAGMGIIGGVEGAVDTGTVKGAVDGVIGGVAIGIPMGVLFAGVPVAGKWLKGKMPELLARRTLGLPYVGKVTPEQVKQAYRDTAKTAHPDTPTGSDEAFIRVSQAYETVMGKVKPSPASSSAQSPETPRSSAASPAPQTTTLALSTDRQPAPTPPPTVAAPLTPQATPPVEVRPAPETPRSVSEPAAPTQNQPSQAPPAESTPPVQPVEQAEVAPAAGKAGEDVDSLSYADLRARAKELKLSPVGSLAVLRERVRGASISSQTPPASTTGIRPKSADVNPADRAAERTEPVPSTSQTQIEDRPVVPSEPLGKGRTEYTSMHPDWYGRQVNNWGGLSYVLPGKERATGDKGRKTKTLPHTVAEQLERVELSAKALVADIKNRTKEWLDVRGKLGKFILAPKRVVAEAKAANPQWEADMKANIEKSKERSAKTAATTTAKYGFDPRKLPFDERQAFYKWWREGGKDESAKPWSSELSDDQKRVAAMTKDDWDALNKNDPDEAERLSILDDRTGGIDNGIDPAEVVFGDQEGTAGQGNEAEVGAAAGPEKMDGPEVRGGQPGLLGERFSSGITGGQKTMAFGTETRVDRELQQENARKKAQEDNETSKLFSSSAESAPAAPDESKPAPNAAKAKEPWEMTLLEFAKSKVPPSVAAQLNSPKQAESFRPQHRKDLEGWIREGKTIPPEVLADYPDLKAKGDAAKGGSGSMSALGSPDKPLPSPAAIKGTRIQPSPLTGEVKQIKDIILDLESGVGQVRAGKSSKGSIGTYYPGSSKTVIRFANDLDTTAHETAHRLDDLYGIVADWATPRGVSKSGANLPQKSPFDSELRKDIFQQTIRKNYSVVKKRAEGVAEWIRAWVVNPDMAKSEAPNFTKWFEQKVPQNVRDRLRSFGDDIRRFAGAPGSEQTTANVNLGVDSKSVLDRVKKWFEADGVGGTVGDRLSAAAIDSLAPVWKGVELAKTLRGLSELRPRLDPKINIRLFAGFDRKAMDVLEHGPIRANGERVADIGGIDWLMEPIKAGKPEQVEQNFKDVVAWGLSERIVERAELLNNAVNRAEELEDRIAEAKAAIRKTQEAGDDEIMGSLVDQLKSDLKELSRVKKQVGFAGPTTKMRSWVEARKQRMSGMGGGVMSDIGVAQETLREIASDPARQARAEEGARRYRLWSDAVLRYMLDKGRISQAQFDAIQENNNRYFAMKREYERINDEFIKHGGRKLGTVSKVIQRFKGSTRTIENPYVSLLEQTYTFMREADRNAALRTFTDLLTKERSMYQGKAIDFDQIGSRAKAGDQDAITVFEDGREVKWQFAPEIHRALKDFGKTPDQSIVSKILAAPASLLRTMVVMSPDFMVRNQIRDPIARSIVSETGSKPWSQFYYITPDGMAQFNADLSRFRRMGAGLFGHNLISRDDYYKRFKEAFDKVSGKRNVIITVPSKLVEGYRNFAEFGETIGRMAEFHRAEKKGREQLGYGPEDAAIYAAAQARDIQDFAIAGHVAREVNRYVPFFNAAIRGVMKSVQSAKANPAGFAARWMLYAAMPEVMFYLWNTLVGDDEEEFDQLPTYQRDFFWNMKIGPDLWLAIPKPWELGVMASGIGRAIDAARGKENAFDDYYKSLGSSTSPIGHEGLVGPWRGLIEVMANYDFFRNRPIVSPWEKDLDLGLRKGDDHASRIGQLIQKAFGIDARNADHLIRSYLGGYGRAGLTASDIGREDKPTALRTTGQQLIGVLKSSPAAFGKDAEWVSEYARRKGETNKKWYREFRVLIDTYYDADNSSERDEAAKRIREESSSIRESRPKD